jgi:hypothetical protein
MGGGFGGIRATGDIITIQNCLIEGNTCDSVGSILDSVEKSVVEDSIIADNTSTDVNCAGGIQAGTDGGTFTMTGCTIYGNTTAGSGGGIYAESR